MSKLSDTKSKTLGAISAIQTLLERFPVLTTINNGYDFETSFGFIFNIMKLIGINEDKLIEFISSLLADKNGNGLLYSIEIAVKNILLLNIKNMFTCSMNPLLPNSLMKEYINQDGTLVGGKGIELSINAIDTYGILNNCPCDDKGSAFYFDTKSSIYEDKDGNKPDGYNVNEVWKSCDFNAFLWYVINKGNNTERDKLYWDNRVKYIKKFTDDPVLKEDFFNLEGNSVVTEKETLIAHGEGNNKAEKKQILLCEFVERGEKSTDREVLKIWLNNKRYHNARSFSYKGISYGINRTIFEFNYDFINSLKLFDSKTLVASIINSLYGINLNLSVNVGFSLQKQIMAEKVSTIVKKIMLEDDTEIENCYYSYSNKEYDKMINNAIKKRNGIVTYDGQQVELDYDKIYESINNIDNATTVEGQIQTIKKAFTDVASSIDEQTNSNTDENGNFNLDTSIKVSYGFDLIYKLMEQTITEVVMNVLSPKVALLFQINSIVMGDLDPEDPSWKSGILSSWENFIENSENLIVEMAREIKMLIIKQIYTFLLDNLKPLLKLYASKLLLETIKDYRDLIKNLISACGFSSSSLKSLSSLFDGTEIGEYGISSIDNVDYADIVPNNNNNEEKQC